MGQGEDPQMASWEVPDLARSDPAALPTPWAPSGGRQVEPSPMFPVKPLAPASSQAGSPVDDSQDSLGPAPQQDWGMPELQDEPPPQRQPQYPFVPPIQQGENQLGMASGGPSGGSNPAGGAGGPVGDVAQAALDDPDKWSLCGPVAAVIAVQNGWTVDQAKQFAQANGLWDANVGMHGLQSEVQLLKGMGVDADVGPAHPDLIGQALQQGVYPIISTPKHYFTIKGYDPTSGAYNVSTTGTALRGGSQWMTLDQINQMGGGIDGAAYIRKPGAVGGGQAAVGTGQGQWVGKGDGNPYEDLPPSPYEQEQLQQGQEQIDNQKKSIENAAKAEGDRHKEAMAQAKTAAAAQKEQARHDQVMEQLQQRAQELQRSEDRYKAYNDAQTRNAQFRIQGTFGQQQQAKLLQSALTNPWLQNLTGMAPGYGTPGWNAQTGGGVLQSLLNGWNPQATPDFSYQEGVPQGPKWLRNDLSHGTPASSQGSGGFGAPPAQAPHATGNNPASAQAADQATSPMAAVLGSNPSTTASFSQAGYGGYAPLGSAPPTPNYQQWRGMSPFERASWRTLEESAQPFPAAVQQTRDQWAGQGIFDAPNSAQLSAKQMSPLGIMGQNQTAEMFGQKPEDYWTNQQKVWDKAAAPSITQVT